MTSSHVVVAGLKNISSKRARQNGHPALTVWVIDVTVKDVVIKLELRELSTKAGIRRPRISLKAVYDASTVRVSELMRHHRAVVVRKDLVKSG